MNKTELVAAIAEQTELSKKDCEVISIHEHDESLESYFVSLVGDARHE